MVAPTERHQRIVHQRCRVRPVRRGVAQERIEQFAHGSGIEIAGQDALVIGRSAVVGMPAAFLLVKEDATVTVAHSRTRDLPGKIGRADIVVVAAGRPGLVTGDMLKRGAVVVDVGINVVDGHIRGDVDFE